MIALEYKEEDQQNDERRRFEESDAEQALIHQHDALPPGLKCRRPDDKSFKFFAMDGSEPSLELPPTLTCYFLNGQGHPTTSVLSRIMAMGANTRGARTD